MSKLAKKDKQKVAYQLILTHPIELVTHLCASILLE
jgi:hypothetical protein